MPKRRQIPIQPMILVLLVVKNHHQLKLRRELPKVPRVERKLSTTSLLRLRCAVRPRCAARLVREALPPPAGGAPPLVLA